MTPTFSLIGKAFETYFKRKNFVYLTKIVLVQLLIGIGSAIPFFVISFVLGGLSFVGATSSGDYNPTFFLILAPIAVIVTIALIILGSWLNAAGVVAASQVIKNETIGVRETLKLAWKRTRKFFLVNLLNGIIIFLGLTLFVIPGIVFAVWFSFSVFFVIEGSEVVESLKQSKNLIKNHFWRVVLRYSLFSVLFFTIYTLLSFVPVVGSIVLVLFGPFSILLSYLLFEDLKKLRKA